MKRSLINEFSPKIDSHVVHRRLQQRKKRSEETYHKQCYRMMKIALQIDMEQSLVVKYIVEHLDGDEIGKTNLYEAKNIRELKTNLIIYEKIRGKCKANKKE